MPGVKISELPAATTPLDGTELLPVVQSGVTVQTTLDDIPFLQTGAGAVSRTVQSKLRERINVRDFGAVLDGTTNDLAAFNAAIQSVASGQAIDIEVDGPAYLSGATTNSGRFPKFTFLAGGGITTTPGGSIGSESSRLSWPIQWARRVPNGPTYEYSNNVPSSVSGMSSVKHLFRNIVGSASISTANGYGIRNSYTSAAYGSGFDIAHATVGVWNRTSGQDGGQDLAEWVVAASPTVGGPTTRWGVFACEMNVSNCYADTGWSAKRSPLNNWTGVLQIVPENDDLRGGVATYNALYGIVSGPSGDNKADGIPAQVWNAWLMEPNAVCGDGYGVYASGNDTGTAARNPNAFLGLAQTWKVGIDLSAATFADANKAIVLKSNDRIQFGTGSFPATVSGDSAAATISFGIDGAEALRLARGGASAVNYLNVANAATGGQVNLTAAGSDTNVVLALRSKGTDPIYLQPNSLTTLRLESVASQVNHWFAYGGATGNGPTLAALGTDTNSSANIQGRGTGGVRLKDGAGANKVEVNTTGIGFHATAPVAKPTVTGSRGGNAALASLLTALANYGLITDSTTA